MTKATQIPCFYALICTLREANKELLLVILLVLLLMLLSSFLIYHAEFVEYEHVVKERGNKTFLDIIWWCLKVITTVGDSTYGPTTTFGQMIGGTCAFIGVLIFSLPSFFIFIVQRNLSKTIVIIKSNIKGFSYKK